MEQTVKITLPDDPTAPALVVFDGPLGDVALRLSKDPGSGWTLIAGDPASDGPYYLVDRKLVIPKPRRKGRPDASDRMRKYNEAKKAPADPDPHTPKITGVKHDPALGWDELEEAVKRKQNQRIGANVPDPKPSNPYGLDDDFEF